MSNNLINIELFFLISRTQFDSIILNGGFTIAPEHYFINYVAINIFAYVVIFVIFYLLRAIYNFIFKSVKLNVKN